jgi:glycosyltransferase involved in cell wall biosynthesis
MHTAMFYVVTDSRASYPSIVRGLEDTARAQVVELDPSEHMGMSSPIVSKRRIARRLISPALLRLRRRWSAEDAVLVISWYVLPILALIRIGVLPRPRKLVALGVFVQSPSIRRAVNAILRSAMIPELEVIAFSEGERRTLLDAVGIPPERVHKLIWGGAAVAAFKTEAAALDRSDGPYIFSGGYANRDYATLFAAVEGLDYPVVVVASSRNRLRDPPVNVSLRTDLPEEEFERLLAGCDLLVVPLHATGEASGQSVLFRGIQHGRPFVGTRHDGLIDYLGEDYPGFVPAEDVTALRAVISRAMNDGSFRHGLNHQILARREVLRNQRECLNEVLAILQEGRQQ